MNNILFDEVSKIPMYVSIFGFFLCLFYNAILFVIYRRHSFVLDLEQSPWVLPLVSTVTFALVSIIQDSLMLSLGMVGALSIVRFRTPIKNSFDLGYLFLAISIGVGFASGKIVLSLIVFGFTLLLFYFVSTKANSTMFQDKHLRIECEFLNDTDLRMFLNKYQPRSLVVNGMSFYAEIPLGEKGAIDLLNDIKDCNLLAKNWSVTS